MIWTSRIRLPHKKKPEQIKADHRGSCCTDEDQLDHSDYNEVDVDDDGDASYDNIDPTTDDDSYFDKFNVSKHRNCKIPGASLLNTDGVMVMSKRSRETTHVRARSSTSW
jgi:hypothetical protein